MAKRSAVYQVIPWSGGLNTSVSEGAISDDQLQIAENIEFKSTIVNGRPLVAKRKRQGLVYIDEALPDPDFRSSSGTSRTLYFTSTNLVQSGVTSKENLVSGEVVTITGAGSESTYSVTETALSSVTSRAEVTDVQAVADVSQSLQSTYFTLSAGPGDGDFYVWINVDSGGTDPQLDNRTGVEVGISEGDTANTIASAIQTQVNSLTEFSATVNADTVTITNATAGPATDAADGSAPTGFTITTTTQGADLITYTGTTSLTESETAVTDITVARDYSILNLKDFWYLNSSQVKTQLLIAASDEVKLYKFDSENNRVEIGAGSGAKPSGTVTVINSVVFNNRLILAFDSVGDAPVKYNPDDASTYELLGGSPPDFSLMHKYLGRLWTNDKTVPDRVFYSATGNHEEWNGTSDSGAIDVGIDDGDSVGITGIFDYKGQLYIQKGKSLFRILGGSPEEFKVEKVSDGIGGASHEAITQVDQDDVFFMSRRGFHSITGVESFGDTNAAFLSLPIQNRFNDLDKTKLKKVKAIYSSQRNVIAIAVPSTGTENSEVWFFDTNVKGFYKWPNIVCEALEVQNVNNSEKFLFGTDDGRIIQSHNGTFQDFGTTEITSRFKTGIVYPGGNPSSFKRFKRVGFFYEPIGVSPFTATIQTDQQGRQALSFAQGASGDVLGDDLAGGQVDDDTPDTIEGRDEFVLGQSILGSQGSFAPYMLTIDAQGRGMSIEVTDSNSSSGVEIYGYLIEFIDTGVRQDVPGDTSFGVSG